MHGAKERYFLMFDEIWHVHVDVAMFVCVFGIYPSHSFSLCTAVDVELHLYRKVLPTVTCMVYSLASIDS